jgi:hypothetical protein
MASDHVLDGECQKIWTPHSPGRCPWRITVRDARSTGPWTSNNITTWIWMELGYFLAIRGLHMGWTTGEWILIGYARFWTWTVIQFQIYVIACLSISFFWHVYPFQIREASLSPRFKQKDDSGARVLGGWIRPARHASWAEPSAAPNLHSSSPWARLLLTAQMQSEQNACQEFCFGIIYNSEYGATDQPFCPRNDAWSGKDKDSQPHFSRSFQA